METSIAGGNAYEIDPGICARVRDRGGLPFGQDSFSGAKRASRLAVGGCIERGLHRGGASARLANSFFS
jgi:hypothetical protein